MIETTHEAAVQIRLMCITISLLPDTEKKHNIIKQSNCNRLPSLSSPFSGFVEGGWGMEEAWGDQQLPEEEVRRVQTGTGAIVAESSELSEGEWRRWSVVEKTQRKTTAAVFEWIWNWSFMCFKGSIHFCAYGKRSSSIQSTKEMDSNSFYFPSRIFSTSWTIACSVCSWSRAMNWLTSSLRRSNGDFKTRSKGCTNCGRSGG